MVAKRMWDAEAAVVSIGGLNKVAKLKRDGDDDADQWKTVVVFAFCDNRGKRLMILGRISKRKRKKMGQF